MWSCCGGRVVDHLARGTLLSVLQLYPQGGGGEQEKPATKEAPTEKGEGGQKADKRKKFKGKRTANRAQLEYDEAQCASHPTGKNL